MLSEINPDVTRCITSLEGNGLGYFLQIEIAKASRSLKFDRYIGEPDTWSREQFIELIETPEIFNADEWYHIRVEQTASDQFGNGYKYMIEVRDQTDSIIFSYITEGVPEDNPGMKVNAPRNCVSKANAVIRNVFVTTVDGGPCPASDRAQIGSGWSLVRRAKEKSFSYNDNLAGSIEDGTAHNNPYGDGFSAKFEDTVKSYNQFLFATADCTKWILSDKSEIDVFSTKEVGDQRILVDSTHLDQTQHSIDMFGGVGGAGKYPLVTYTSYSEGDVSAEETSLYHEDNLQPTNNDADTRGGLNVWIRKMPVSWSPWTEFTECSVSCGSGIKSRTHECFHDHSLLPDTRCEGSNKEIRVCNTDLCPRVQTTCYCPDGQVRCRDKDWCNNKEDCELNSWFKAKTIDNTYECRDRSYSVCKGWGDPHIVTFDNAKSDVYGVAQYVFAQHNGTEDGVPQFKILMNTKKLRHVSAIEYMYFTFPTRVGELIEIETDRYGKSNIYIAGVWYQLYPQKNADFTFTKRGKALFVETWFGMKIYHKRLTYEATVPAYYQSETFGLCGNGNKDKLDDYTKKDGEVLPFPPQGGYKRTWQEYESATSWITGSAQLRGCLMYDQGYQEVTDALKAFEAGPDATVDLDCKPETLPGVITACNDLLMGDWLKECRNLIDVSQAYADCKVDYCMDPTDETKKVVLEPFINSCSPKLDSQTHDIICNWPTLSGLTTESCGVNQVYHGCADTCMLVTECGETEKDCPDEPELKGICICLEGYVMSDGECILVEDCPTGGTFAQWGAWLSECSVECGGGETSRSRLCLGPGACDGDGTEKIECNTCACGEYT